MATTARRHNHNNIAIHGRRGARVAATGIKVVARTETTVTMVLEKLTFQEFPGRGDIGDGTTPPESFDSIHTVAEYKNVHVPINIPAAEAGGVTALTLADLIDALTGTTNVTIKDPAYPDNPSAPNVPIVTPIIELGSVVWVDAHDSADHLHIIGRYLHDLNVNPAPTSASPTYVPFAYVGHYIPDPDEDPDAIPVQWWGTSPTYFTNYEEDDLNPNNTPELFSDYPIHLLDNYPIFDENENPTLLRLTISFETIDEYLFPEEEETKAEDDKK
jgi:hypothetical protein